KRVASRMTSMHRSRRVTIQPSRAGIHAAGVRSRSLASAGEGAPSSFARVISTMGSSGAGMAVTPVTLRRVPGGPANRYFRRVVPWLHDAVPPTTTPGDALRRPARGDDRPDRGRGALVVLPA